MKSVTPTVRRECGPLRDIQDRPVRVLFLNSCVSGGGAGRSLVAYLKHDAGAIEPHIVMPEPGVIAQHLTRGEQIHYLPEFVERPLQPPYRWMRSVPGLDLLGGIVSLFVAARKISDLARRIEAEVIYCNHMLAKPVGAAVGSMTGIPVIFHGRNIHDQRHSERLFYQYLARRGSVVRILCNSAATAAPYAEVAAEKTCVVPNFVDLSTFRPDLVSPSLRREIGVDQDTVVVGYLGRIVQWKGIEVLLRAFARLAPDCPRAVLALVGDNDAGIKRDLKSEYSQLADQLGIGERVHFLGFKEDVRPYLADFDINTLPSIAPEPFGRVLVEGMALGVPPIIAAHGGAMEIVRDGVEGLWTRPGDASDLAAKLNELIRNPERRQQMRARSMARVREHFDGRQVASTITHHIKDVARTARRPRAA